MFDNIGNKIKNLVKTIYAIELVIFVILGIALAPVGGILLVPVGIFIAWISSFILYGYGELIDNLQKQTKQNETIISLLSNSGRESIDTPVSIKPQESRIKTADVTGFSAMNIPDDNL